MLREKNHHLSREKKRVQESAPSFQQKRMSAEERNAIVARYMPMIKCIAKKISSRLPPHVDFDDLISNGAIGLMDAIAKYDPERENKFRTYAEFRIRGAILDALRSDDWIPRSVRDKAKRVNRATRILEMKLGRDPEDSEVAEFLELSLEEYHILVFESRPVNVLSIDDSAFFNKTDKQSILKAVEEESESVSKEVSRKSMRRIIQKTIEELPERQRMVLSLYYYEGFNLRKIGAILKVTESRVSQLHAQAVRRLKIKLSHRVSLPDLKAA